MQMEYSMPIKLKLVYSNNLPISRKAAVQFKVNNKVEFFSNIEDGMIELSNSYYGKSLSDVIVTEENHIYLSKDTLDLPTINQTVVIVLEKNPDITPASANSASLFLGCLVIPIFAIFGFIKNHPKLVAISAVLIIIALFLLIKWASSSNGAGVFSYSLF
jgi:hypothetical protein